MAFDWGPLLQTLAGGAIGIGGTALTLKVTGRREQDRELRAMRLPIYARLTAAGGQTLEAVQAMTESTVDENSKRWTNDYISAIEAFATAGNEATLICDPPLQDAIFAVNAVTSTINLSLTAPTAAAVAAVASAHRQPLHDRLSDMTDAIRKELGRPPLPQSSNAPIRRVAQPTNE